MSERRTMMRTLAAFGALALVAGSALAQDDEAPAMRPGMTGAMMAARMAPDPEVAEARQEARTARMALRDARMLPAGGDRDEAVDEAREDVDEAREEFLEARDEARAERLEAHDDERAAAREARRERWNRLRGRLGVERPGAVPPAVRAELRQHARRMAKLARIAALADEADDDGNEERAERLMTRERARHEARLAALTNPSAGATAGAEVE